MTHHFKDIKSNEQKEFPRLFTNMKEKTNSTEFDPYELQTRVFESELIQNITIPQNS